MNKEEIYRIIKDLAKSQGFYGNVLKQINDHPDILEVLETKDFKDVVDLIMYFEDGNVL